MINIFKKIPKKILIPTTVISTVALFVALVIFNLEKSIEIFTALFFNFKVRTESIEFRDNKIFAEKIELLDKDGKLMVLIPKADATYDSLFEGRVKNIYVKNATAFIRREKDKKINFVKAFYKKKLARDKKKVMKNYKPFIYKFADKLVIDNLELNYEDLNFSKPIRKQINTSGNLRFNQKKALEIYVKAKKDKINNADIEYTFSNEEEPYSMTIKSKNLKFEEEWGQYIWDNPKINYLGGEVESDIKLSYLGRFGEINLKSGKLKYVDYDEDIKNINIAAIFDKYNINLKAEYSIFNRREKINLTYIDKELKILASLRNIDSYKLLKYKPLQNKNLDFSKVNIKKISAEYKYSKQEGSALNIRTDLGKSEFKNIIFKDFKFDYYVKGNKKYIKDSYLLADIFDVEEKFSLDMTNKKNIYDFTLQTNSKNNSNLIPNMKSKIKIKDKKEKLDLNFSSNLINFKGNYLKKEKLLNLFGENFNFNLDKKNRTLSFEQSKNNIKNIELFYNLKNSDFNLDYDLDKLNLEKKYKDDKISVELSGKGYINRENKILDSKGEIKNFNLNYKGFIKGLSLDYFTKNQNGKTSTEFDGSINKVGYGDYGLSALKLNLDLRDNIFKIIKLKNSKFSSIGEINLKNKNIKLDYSIKNLNNEDINSSKLSFNLGSLKGTLLGDLKNLSGKVSFDNLVINSDKYRQLNSKGNLILQDKELIIPLIKLEKNSLTGKYNLKTKKFKGEVNILEENIGRYTSLEKLRARLVSKIDIEGELFGQNKSFDADIKGSLDRFYYNSKEVPNLSFKAKYKSKNFKEGILEFEKISVLNDRKKNLLSLKGYIDLNKKYLDISTLEKHQDIDLSLLRRYIKLHSLKGKLLTDFYLKGYLENPTYNLELKSSNTEIKDIPLDEVVILLDGDFNQVNIKKIKIDYIKNKFYGYGNYDFKKKLYSLDLKSNKINFEDLNRFLKYKNIKDFSGSAEIDLNLRNNNSVGSIKISNFGFDVPKENFKLSELQSDITIKDNKININFLKSRLNDGVFKASGLINIPKSFGIFDKDILKNLDYTIKTSLNNFRHKLNKVSDISLHSDLLLSNKKIEGAIYLDDGTIYDIPNNYKNIWRIISSFLFKKVRRSNNRIEYELPDYLKNLPYLNLAVIMSNPLKIEMNSFTTFADEVKGKVYANLNLKGKNGEFYLLGNAEAENSFIVLNSNKFILDRALVSFNRKDILLPNFNPSIFLESHVNIDGENLGFNVNGKLKELRFNIVSRNGSSNGDLNSLISDIRTGDVQTEINTPYYNLLKSIISNQITNTVFGSTTKTIKKMFKLTKFTLKSDVTTANINDIDHFSNSRNNSVDYFKINTILEVEDNLYKDRIFLNANTKLFSTSTNINNEYSKIDEKNIKEYDINLEYRRRHHSIGVGMGSIPQRYRLDKGKDYSKKNYHVDFKFRKKFNKFSELFSF